MPDFMATSILPSILVISMFLFFLISATQAILSDADVFRSMGSAKQTRLHFFVHDIGHGPSATNVKVAGPNITSATNFGNIVVADDPLTDGPRLDSSKLIGKTQGLYAFASKEEVSLLMYFNLVFTHGLYAGSTLTLIGQNAVEMTIREMPIVGGSGLFRMARGYALARTYKISEGSGTIVEYDVFVIH